MLDQYSDITESKEEIVVLCVNEILEKRTMMFKPMLKIVIEDGVSDEESDSKNDGIEFFISEQPCSICITNNINFSFQKCHHSFCKECIINYIESQILSGNILKIRCPFDGCKEFINEKLVKEILPEKLLMKYNKFHKRITLYSKGNIKFCIKPDCEFYYILKKDQKKIICQCGAIICTRCNNYWHEGKTCEEVKILHFFLLLYFFKCNLIFGYLFIYFFR